MNKPNNFLNISPDDCLYYYPEIIANAERHFKVARILSDEQEFGNAISHLVLGSEELVKAVILYFDGIGFRIRTITGVKKFFTNHKVRHLFVLAFIMISYNISSSFLMVKSIQNRKLDLNGDGEAWARDFLDNKGAGMLKRIVDELEFWAEADNYKMKGFYVDYADVLISPSQITKEEFGTAFKAARYFRHRCLSGIQYLIDLSDDERMTMVSMANQDRAFCSIIEQVLKSSRELVEFR